MRRATPMLLLLLTFLARPAGEARAAPDDELRRWARDVVASRAADGDAAPAFPTDREWLNVSRPLTLEGDLRGKVVLLDFWCYCCINCLHVLPDLEYLEHKYAEDAFAVVGVHSAKFQNEKDAANVRDAVLRYEIEHPVVNDGDFRIWRAYGARAWPTLVLVGADGTLIGALSGEGHRDELDALIEAALDHYRAKGDLEPAALPIRLERRSRAAGALAYPGKIAVDGDGGRLFVADSNHHRILELTLDGQFRRAWGDGRRGFADGGEAEARFFRPQGLAHRGNELWVADTENHAVRRIDLASGRVTTVAGTGSQGRLRHGRHEGRAAALSSPWDLLFVGEWLYIAMAGTHQLWRLDPATGRVEHFAGSGLERRMDGTSLGAWDPDLNLPSGAAFAQPSGLAWDGTWLYVADSESSSIVRVGLEGPVETLAGANTSPTDLFHFGDEDGAGHGRRFQHPLGVAAAGDRLYVADSYNHKIKTLDPETGEVRTYLGTGAPGLADDPPAFREPGGIAAHDGILWVADTNNHAIRRVSLATGEVTTLALQGVPIPQDAARASGAGAAWPELPGTESVSLLPVAVVPGRPLTVRVRLMMPGDWHLTEESPSALRLEGLGEPIDRPITANETRVLLPGALPATGATLTLRLLYYVCRDEGSCRVRSAVFRVPLTSDPDGRAEVVVSDLFVP